MKEKSNIKLNFNILQLQNLIKRDPPSYYEDFMKQYDHFKSLLQLFKYTPNEYNENVASLVMFLAQVSSYYQTDLKDYPFELVNLLKEYASVLDPSMRLCLVKALILMRNRGVLPPTDLITLSFELLRCKDKVLRKLVQVHIVTDLKNMNAKHKNMKVNSVIHSFMSKMLNDSNATAAKVSLDIMIELYRKNVWRDAKSVNSIATACFSKVNKILVAGHHFFLGIDQEDEDEDKKDSDSEEEHLPNLREVMQANKVNKKSRKRQKMLKKTKQVLKKSKKRENKEVFDFSAIHLLHDPQGMAEKLLKNLQSMNERFEIKLLVMNLISRLVGIHELILLNFYPLLIRFLKPHQRDVTKILMFAAQASHEQVPPDAIEPVIKAIAYNFITERNSTEVITVGLNAIREICLRCPFAIDQDLLRDLVQYQKYKNKNVMMAARALVQLFRKINPKMLQRKDRSRPTESSKESALVEYGVINAKSYIPGSEVLPLKPSNDEISESPIDEDKDASDSDGSWVNVSHSEDELPDSADEDESAEDEESLVEENETAEAESTSQKSESQSKSEKAQQKVGDGDKMQSETAREKATSVSQSRILSQEEFRKIKAAQLAKEVHFAKGKKRKAEAETSEPGVQKSEVVSLKDIEKLHKRAKSDKESRLASIKEGREDREKFGRRRQKRNPFSSKTQKQHNKNKAFAMIKHKVRSKVKRSFKDKQLALRNALLKQKKNR